MLPLARRPLNSPRPIRERVFRGRLRPEDTRAGGRCSEVYWAASGRSNPSSAAARWTPSQPGFCGRCPALRDVAAAACGAGRPAGRQRVKRAPGLLVCASSPCRQLRASATRPRTTSGAVRGCSRCATASGLHTRHGRVWRAHVRLPACQYPSARAGAQPSRFSTIPRVLGETRWPFSSFPACVRSPGRLGKCPPVRMPSSTRRATT